MGGTVFLFLHGIFQKELSPAIYPFYSIVIGLFLFMQAYLQFLSSMNITRFLANIGVVIFLRSAFGVSVLLYSLTSEMLPLRFFMIAAVDLVFAVLQISFSYKGEATNVLDLFIPK